MNPSMRSKLLQNALNGPSPKISARNTTARNAPTLQRKSERFGRNDGSRRASMSQHAKITSTIIRNAKFFPVIKGKNSGDATIRGTNGTRKTPTRVTPRNILSMVCIDDIVSHATLNTTDRLQNPEYKLPPKLRLHKAQTAQKSKQSTNYTKHKLIPSTGVDIDPIDFLFGFL